ncbi:hypothetical protein BDY21DRAFT_178230 [Lineolata rhizophorae]|uniref:Uncharacterized protein n=1 Tax=Lineolata rhizophorae TaxID=578093 RepID=A0A6A6P715_9PEZI|nr:hypothetical protein BDY21DRAFT_178230 [Lineolata rhizophorae]
MPLDPPQHYANDPDDRQTPAPAITHDPPSLPASPLPKRTKIIDEEKGAPAAAASSRLGE